VYAFGAGSGRLCTVWYVVWYGSKSSRTIDAAISFELRARARADAPAPAPLSPSSCAVCPRARVQPQARAGAPADRAHLPRDELLARPVLAEQRALPPQLHCCAAVATRCGCNALR
jgi:hypothetical protein